jgi:hypothetical protein
MRLQPHRSAALTYDRPVNARSDVAAVQSATGVLMVRPARFAHNVQTSGTNRFQQPAVQPDQASVLASAEFDALSSAVAGCGVAVCCVDDTPAPAKPDAAFPNNWVSFHRDGSVVLYPMMAPNRRSERRADILAQVEARLKFQRQRLIDLSLHEREGRFLEGTGSLVLDHVHRIAYACRSPRTDESLVRTWSQQLGYEPLLFDASGADGTAIYHTNVMLSIGAGWAVVCTEAIASGDRARVLQQLRAGREVIEISMPLMARFGANILELRASARTVDGARLLVMSAQAQAAFEHSDPDAWERLRDCVDQVLAVPVPTIENVGGGGVRCMLAEVPETTM